MRKYFRVEIHRASRYLLPVIVWHPYIQALSLYFWKWAFQFSWTWFGTKPKRDEYLDKIYDADPWPDFKQPPVVDIDDNDKPF